MKRKMILTGLSVLFAVLANPLLGSMDRYLIAHWTFSDGRLEGEDGQSFVKTGTGANQTLTSNADTVSLGSGTMLYCGAINATDSAQLKRSVTIWCRFRLDSTPDENAFLWGLINDEASGDWGNMIFTLRCVTTDKLAVGGYGWDNAGKVVATGPSKLVEMPQGSMVTLALIYDSATGELVTIVNGKQSKVRVKAGRDLADFSGFALGRLKQSGGPGITFEEVRIYTAALGEDWIAEIEPIKAK